jgi:Domain of unknown function (DUF4404)
MAEHSEQLRSTMAELHEQLGNTREITPELRDLLSGLAADIERILAAGRPGESTGVAAAGSRAALRASLIARLSHAAREFEGTHPTLSGTIGSIIDALGQMGV